MAAFVVAGRLAAVVLGSGCSKGSPESFEQHSVGAAVSFGFCRRDLALR